MTGSTAKVAIIIEFDLTIFDFKVKVNRPFPGGDNWVAGWWCGTRICSLIGTYGKELSKQLGDMICNFTPRCV